MEIIIMIAQLLLALTLLVFVHELGHFLAAKLFKTRVDKFYLFFDFLFPMPNVLNFALWKKKIGDTEYGFGWFPLGGYVSIAGMVDETQDANQLSSEPQPWEYRSKRSWQKMIIILGGIIFNIILGIIIYSGLLKWETKEYLPVSEINKDGVVISELGKSYGFRDGDKIVKVDGSTPERLEDLTPISSVFGATYEVERIENNTKVRKTIELPKNYMKKFSKDIFLPIHHKNIVEGLAEKGNAKKGGLQLKDQIIRVDSQSIHHFDFFTSYLQTKKGKTILLTVLRNGKETDLNIAVDTNGKLGFVNSIEIEKEQYKNNEYSWGQSIKYATENCFRLFAFQAINIAKMIQGEVKPKESVGGIITMAKAFGGTWDWVHFWNITALISIALAFGNLLPIPGLDGGHAVIIIIEAILRRPLSPKTHQIIQNVGLYIILLLTVYVLYIDITRK